jgi:PAS domain S-box-containing protein
MPEDGVGPSRKTADGAAGLLEQLPGAAAVLAPDGQVLAWNGDAAALLGWTNRDRPRLGSSDASWLVRLRESVGEHGRGSVRITRRRIGGVRRVVALSACRTGDRDMLVLMRDCTKQAAKRRSDSKGERRLRQFLDQLSEVVHDHAVIIVDRDGYVVSWNAGAERLTGHTADAIIDMHLADLLESSAEDANALLDKAVHGGRMEIDTRVRRSEGESFPAHVTVARLNGDEQAAGYAVVLRDLSEQVRAQETLRRSEDQLRHSQKMDAVGRLASGIAHDFNNVLTAIQGHVQFLLEDLPSDLPSRDDAEEIRKAADRATELTRQLLTFARKQPSRPVSLNPNALIEDIEKLLRRLIRADVTLDTMLEEVPNVVVDPGQLEQVIVNLVVNARDAIGSAGAVTVTTSCINLDEIYSARGLKLPPGEYVMIAVSDTGAGMSLDTQVQIFEPFFTTKAEGTGLGLSTVYGIVKQAGGHISVYSEEGSGTTFKLFLPVRGDDEYMVQLIRHSDSAETGTVLLVEDDDAVRALGRRTLESKGYAVMEAADGEEALRIANDHADIDVIVTDLSMPKLSGEDLAARIRETKPDAGIVVMSGFSQLSLVREGRIRKEGHFLEKPFTPRALVDVVRQAMHHPQDQSSTNST